MKRSELIVTAITFLVVVTISLVIFNYNKEPDHYAASARQMPDEFSHYDIATKVWREVSQRTRINYRKPLFTNVAGVRSACRVSSSINNPFYCPADRTIYMSPHFKGFLESRGAIGDMPLAFVMHHEVAHDLQSQAGLLWKLDRRTNDDIRLSENMADCLAGYSLYYAQSNYGYMRGLSDEAEVVLALNSVGCNHGDCSHGSSESRIDWFFRGFQKEGVQNCTAALYVQHLTGEDNED